MSIELLDEPVTALTVQDRAAVALGSTQTRLDLAAMALKSVNITEIKNVAGRAECHSAAMALADARIAITKTGKAARDDATKFSKAIIDEEKSLIAITSAEEARLLALRDAWDNAIAIAKAAKEQAERERITAIHERIAFIRGYVALAAGCRTAAATETLLGNLSRIALDDFEEFASEAAAAHADAMKRVESILVERHQIEQEQARIMAENEAAAAVAKAERIENERQRQELATQRAEIAAEQAALLKAARDAAIVEADRLATERQAFADERAKFDREIAFERAKVEEAKAALLPAKVEELPAIEFVSPPEPTLSKAMADMLDMPEIQPSAIDLIQAVAEKFNVPMFIAAEWLTNCADDIANFD